MRIPYRIEIFGRDFICKSFAPIIDKKILNDALTIEKTTVSVMSIEANKGDFARIIKNGAEVIYQGVVADIEIAEKSQELTLQPLVSLFDTTVFIASAPTGTIEHQLASLITNNFISNSDMLQNYPITITETSQTAGTLVLDTTANIYTLLTTAMKSYGIVCNLTFDPDGTMACSIGTVEGNRIIEADLQGIIEKSFVIGDSYGQANKLLCYYIHTVDDTEVTETLIFYLHSDGSVSTTDTDRVQPVFSKVTKITVKTGETFADVAYAKACEELKPHEYNNEITITVPEGSGIVPQMPIGQRATIYRDGTVYDSMLTGSEINEGRITYIFGCVRVSLTKRLIMERRAIQ